MKHNLGQATFRQGRVLHQQGGCLAISLVREIEIASIPVLVTTLDVGGIQPVGYGPTVIGRSQIIDSP